MGGIFSGFDVEFRDADLGFAKESEHTYKRVAELITENKGHVLIITGAGISSHVLPTFRSSNLSGLWDVIASPSLDKRNFYKEPSTSWKLYANVRNLEKNGTLYPSHAHRVIHYLIKYGYVNTLITQNIDSLHSFKGDESHIIEIHGKVTDYGECEQCNKLRKVDQMEIIGSGQSPKCDICGNILKPPIAFFQDLIPKKIRDASYAALNDASVLILVGTHCKVDPVLSFVQEAYKNGTIIIEINPDETIVSKISTMHFAVKADEAMDAIGAELFPDIDFSEKIKEEPYYDISQ